MRVERKSTIKNPPEQFTGDVWLDPVAVPQDDGQQAGAGIVRFAPGARTAWHSHPGGQTLRILEGIARIQSRGGEIVEARPGDIIYTPPGEEHWHGAAEDAFMVHLAVWDTLDGQPSANWGEHVTDAEYRGEAS